MSTTWRSGLLRDFYIDDEHINEDEVLNVDRVTDHEYRGLLSQCRNRDETIPDRYQRVATIGTQGIEIWRLPNHRSGVSLSWIRFQHTDVVRTALILSPNGLRTVRACMDSEHDISAAMRNVGALNYTANYLESSNSGPYQFSFVSGDSDNEIVVWSRHSPLVTWHVECCALFRTDGQDIEPGSLKEVNRLVSNLNL